MAGRYLAIGHGLGADGLRQRAARAQPAAGGNVDRARDLARQHEGIALGTSGSGTGTAASRARV